MRKILVCSATLALGACGVSPIPIADWCARYEQVICGAAENCGCFDATTRSLCSTYAKMECQSQVDGVNAGKMAYDASQAGQCLHDLDAIVSACSVHSPDTTYYPPACEKMVVGALAEGAPCDLDNQCQPGLWCEAQLCAVLPKDGQACVNQQCGVELFCGNDSVCHAHRAQGGACPEGSNACADKLYCDPTTTTCQPLLGVGGDCSLAGWACSGGLYCSTAAKLCTPDPGEGASCAEAGCADGLFCDYSTHICQKKRGAGQVCSDNEECQGNCVSNKCSQGSCPF
jgi:hypothetical protein